MTAFVTPICAPVRRSGASLRQLHCSPVCTIRQSPNPAKSPSVLRDIAERLKRELPSLFSSTPDYSIYSSDVTFEDPLTKFRGVSNYASNIKFLSNSPVFSSATLTLYDTAIITEDTIRTRWTLSMLLNLPWSPCVAFTGQSDYVVDLTTQKVIHHYDYWDSLHDSKFFSFPAVADLLSQCRSHIGPRDLGGFHLLRRTEHFEIRKFNNPIFLARDARSDVEAWRPAPQGEALSCAAVISLPSAPKNNTAILDQCNKLRRLLRGKSYATVGENHYYVCPKLRGQVFHEVWLELPDANAFVDT